MSTLKKLIERMKNQPHGISAADADRVLRAYGYNPDRQKGSHKQYLNDKGDLITIKQETPLKKVYVLDILKRIGE